MFKISLYFKNYELCSVLILYNEKSWIPCIFELSSIPGKVVCTPQELAVKENVSNGALTYTFTGPTMSGNRRLQLSGVMVGITKADSANFISKIEIRAMSLGQVQMLWENTNQNATIQKFQQGFGPIDCGNYDALKVVIRVNTSAEPHNTRIGFVALQASYQ